MSERPGLDEIGKWARTLLSDAKKGLETGWQKVYSEYKEKYSVVSQAETKVETPEKEPGKEDNETVIIHEAKKPRKKGNPPEK